MFGATIRGLVAGGYLGGRPGLEVNDMPAEVFLTDRAHAVIDSWPGATPDQIVENLLAVLAEQAEHEPDPAKKKRLAQFGEIVKELGVSTASEVLTKVMLGG
jgi:hypothetical protein